MTFTEIIGDVRVWSATIFAGAIIAGLVAHAVLFAILARGAARMKSSVTDLIVRYCRRPGYLMFPTVAVPKAA